MPTGGISHVRKSDGQQSAAQGCRVKLAHCIVGAARSFVQETVYRSILENFVLRVAEEPCWKHFFVLELDSARDSPKGGEYIYTEQDLWHGPWKALPPSGAILNPPFPDTPQHWSFRDVQCQVSALPLIDKLRKCTTLVSDHELTAGSPFDWLVYSRPDVVWEHNAVLEQLLSSSPTGPKPLLHGHSHSLDLFMAVDRRVVPRLLDAVLLKCVLPGSGESHWCGALTTCALPGTEDYVWCAATAGLLGCDCWLKAGAAEIELEVVLHDLRFKIRRLKTAKQGGWTQDDYVRGNGNQSFKVEDALRWNLRVHQQLYGGFKPRFVGSIAPTRSFKVVEEGGVQSGGCRTFVDSLYCFRRRVALFSLQYTIGQTDEQVSLPTLQLGLWWQATHLGRDISPNTTMLKFTPLGIPRTLSARKGLNSVPLHEEASRTALVLQRGRCLGFTLCGRRWQDPFVRRSRTTSAHSTIASTSRTALAFSSEFFPPVRGEFGPFVSTVPVDRSIRLEYYPL
eukprot:TRINITY_DN74580_c0_g1_i1.p1 TRINITY_DN74580_c0_g1~~TRINITY_DN74580_c0_g1_i1.p1  ORF type:complete len:509 (+),score=39.90 TRINITY_DN74580_c0_g1_i1:35-1561(+)